MADRVRVRYAPSPTGDPHVGNIRTALFNWLYARSTGGSFIVRIEDTDRARIIPKSQESILEALKWLGLDWDEGPDVGGPYEPYVQSKRLHLYQEAAHQLIASNMAYYCYCSANRLKEMRAEQTQSKLPPGYDRLCREIEANPNQQLRSPYVIRFKMPLDGETHYRDLIRDEISFDNKNIDDFVIIKSDGYPTYHLASVVDDHAMEITHIMRSDEWVSSTPKHVQLYKALNYEMPIFAHLPIILGPDKSKLSKRHGSVSIMDYKSGGFLPDAMVNFLSLMGWSIDDHTEIVNRQNLIKMFSMERIGRAGAVFNHEKLNWMNGTYIRNMDINDLATAASQFLREHHKTTLKQPISETYLRQIMPLIQERIKTFAELPDLIDFFFIEELDFPTTDMIQKGMDKTHTARAIDIMLEKLKELETWNHENIESTMRSLADQLNIKNGQLFGTARIAITGRKVTPPLFETMEILGKKKCVYRLESGNNKLKAVD